MIVEIISTGTELLLGEILNTNFQYLSQNLNRLGFDVLYETTVGDNEKRMEEVLRAAMERADVIITTGGLGPTRGDITKETVMKVCNREGHLDTGIWEKIEVYFAKRGKVVPLNNKKQAIVPSGAEILKNEAGTAPGIWLEYDGKTIILLPGPPAEVKDICEKKLWNMMLKKFAGQGIILSRVLHLYGIGESLTAEIIDDLIMNQTNPTLAIYARCGETIIRITAKAENSKTAGDMIKNMQEKLTERLGKYIYGIDDESLAGILGQLLLRHNVTIAFAESCSGGLASSLLTDIPGSSEYFLGSVVTYTNMAKNKLLKVHQATLDKFGAISSETACEMAVNVKNLLGSNYGVSITGNAGPGASENKEVGLVYIAVASKDAVYCQKHRFASNRTENKLRIALTALSLAIDKIKSENENTAESK